MTTPFIRRARISDVKTIHSLLLRTSEEGLLLPRPLNQLYQHIRDFVVLDAGKEDGSVLGCCALAITWEDIAEIRSLVLSRQDRGKGYGRSLVEACLQESRELGIFKVFTLTYQVDFFGKLGFTEVSKDVLPQKVWSDCINCPKFPDCDEHAMILELQQCS